MATAKQIIDKAKSQVGTKATNVKKCKYNDWYYGSAVSGDWADWCETFVQWVFNQCGASALLYGKTANCGYQARQFKDKGALVYNKDFSVLKASQVKAGDVVFFHWSDDHSTYCPGVYTCDHVGIVVAVNSNGTITTVEGNTGSTYNGEVMLRTRSLSVVSCVGRPKYEAGTVTPSVDPAPKLIYRVRSDGKWLKEVDGVSSYAGTVGKPITDIAIKPSKGKVRYRVHIKGGKWLPYVTGYDISDHENGYAGDKKPVDAVEVYYETPADIVNKKGYLKAKYRVSPIGGSYYGWQYDDETTGGQDGYAGLFGKTIDRVQMTLSK